MFAIGLVLFVVCFIFITLTQKNWPHYWAEAIVAIGFFTGGFLMLGSLAQLAWRYLP